MNSMIYKKKAPLLFFLIPALLFMIVYLYYPFIQNIINSVLSISGLGTAAAGKNAASFLVREAIAYMQARHAEKLTLEDVANHCYVSQWHLSKLMNKHAQMTFYDLLNDIRINEAKRLLQNPGLKIGDIGQMVGYCDPGHFARVFKKLTGMSANEYRNQTC